MDESKINPINKENTCTEYELTGDQIQEMIKRKADFLAGKTSSRPWSEVKKTYET